LEAQELVRGIVREAFPSHRFVGEEGESLAHRSAEDCHWIVDPLDGTTNYVHNIPHYATSIAVERQGRLLAGAIYDPVLDEMYTATEGGGAQLNGSPIRVSSVLRLSEAVVAASFPAKVEPDLPALTEFAEIMCRCQGIRRGGSAALNLAYLAAGRFDAYWAADLFPWDAAAGALLFREAGGTLTDLAGGEFDVWQPLLLAAATESLHRELRAVLDAAHAGRSTPPE